MDEITLEDALKIIATQKQELAENKETIEQLRKSIIKFQRMADDSVQQNDDFKHLLLQKYPHIFYEILDLTNPGHRVDADDF